jgi:hypothetical protein
VLVIHTVLNLLAIALFGLWPLLFSGATPEAFSDAAWQRIASTIQNYQNTLLVLAVALAPALMTALNTVTAGAGTRLYFLVVLGWVVLRLLFPYVWASFPLLLQAVWHISLLMPLLQAFRLFALLIAGTVFVIQYPSLAWLLLLLIALPVFALYSMIVLFQLPGQLGDFVGAGVFSNREGDSLSSASFKSSFRTLARAAQGLARRVRGRR